ncbi:MAG TPA: serine/threonine-protein kinase, partial [Polyangiaceae bacterium]|nr:serine/threonine-protein kinase [Polyangiaceae bacterium]
MNRAQPFGRYELIDRISAGGMAEVFRARDAERGGAIVALKKILPHVAEDEEFIEMFTDEARIASSLEHPHIARTLDFGSIGTSYYIAFEYVRGKDMRAVYERAVKNGEIIPTPFLLYVFARIGEGLSYAHARKDANGAPVSIVHRDVSPQNIIVSYGGDVKLIDFGIAKAAGKLSRTAVGAIKGKFGYMSPEQVRGLEIDQRTDVFSLGITMWEMFTRKRLFQADNELLVLEKIRNFKVIAPSSIDPSLPSGLDDIITKALAKDPQDRYQTAKELYRDLNILAQSAGKVASRENVAAYMQKAFSEGNQDSNVSGGLHEPAPESQSGPRETPSRPAGSGMSYKAENSMAADSPKQAGANDKRSDLDIFEGLGKKNGPPPRTSAPPAPPPSRAPGPPPAPSSMGDIGKKTLMGIAAPAGAQGGPPVMGARSQPPMPPPTGRISSLPAVNAPPPKSAPPPPPAASTKPAPYGVAPSAPAPSPAGGMDMDWDDEDEATHIFDKEESQAGPAPSAPRPAAGAMAPPPSTGPLPQAAPPPARVSAPPAPPRPPMAQTMAMSGSQMPPPPPGRSAPPPPPSSVGAGFARASGGSAAPGPSPLINQNALNHQAMTMPLGSQNPMNLAGQQTTEPLKMPPRPPSAPPPQNMGGGFAMTTPLQQNNPFLANSGGVAAAPPPSMQQQQQQQMQTAPTAVGMQAYDIPQPQVQAPRTMEATALVRPPQKSSAGIIIGLLMAILVIGGAVGVWFFVIPHTGNIAVNVQDAKGGAVG